VRRFAGQVSLWNQPHARFIGRTGKSREIGHHHALKSDVESRLVLHHDMDVATLSLSDEQVVQLVKQLPLQSKQRVLADLTAERDRWWETAAREGEQDMRRLAADRGLDWAGMTEAQREAFVDKVLHEP
jgi:hypothetical protein